MNESPRTVYAATIIWSSMFIKNSSRLLGAQIASAADQGGSRLPECHLGTVNHFGGPPLQHFAATGLVSWAQPQPIGELLFTREGIQIHAYLRDHALRHLHVDAIHLRPV